METYQTQILRVQNSNIIPLTDFLAVEEPLEIRIRFGKGLERQEKSLAITMRTPGNDLKLAAGFLFSEGIVDDFQEIQTIRYCRNVEKEEQQGNVVRVELSPEVVLDFKKLERRFYTNSSCGVCGKTSIEALEMGNCPILPAKQPSIATDLIYQFPTFLRKAQEVFESTGGLHAAGLFDEKGNLLILQEDVGRHNAVDKLIGAAMYKRLTNLSNCVIVVSGRMSFELVQKAIRAGIPMMVAVGAPSSLAVQLAKRFGMTLVGFVRDKRFNIYCGVERIFHSTK